MEQKLLICRKIRTASLWLKPLVKVTKEIAEFGIEDMQKFGDNFFSRKKNTDIYLNMAKA